MVRISFVIFWFLPLICHRQLERERERSEIIIKERKVSVFCCDKLVALTYIFFVLGRVKKRRIKVDVDVSWKVWRNVRKNRDEIVVDIKYSCKVCVCCHRIYFLWIDRFFAPIRCYLPFIKLGISLTNRRLLFTVARKVDINRWMSLVMSESLFNII